MEKKHRGDGLDAIDKELLALLQENAKYTHKELAAKLGLTVTPVYERVKRLEKDGYIRKYAAILDRKKVGKGLLVFCHLSLSEHTAEVIKGFEQAIGDIEEVLECYHISGTSDYLLKICLEDIDTYHKFIIHRLVNIPGIANLRSDFVMHEIKDSNILKV